MLYDNVRTEYCLKNLSAELSFSAKMNRKYSYIFVYFFFISYFSSKNRSFFKRKMFGTSVVNEFSRINYKNVITISNSHGI